MKISTVLTILALSLMLACSKKTETPPTGAAPATQAEGKHAGGAVKPGSHEDWCGEHGVPESQCTKCNPELIAAFKATNDWCEEHGVPESQCTKCNPNLKIVRPPKETGAN